jgi:Fe-S-cluster containining protein
LQIHFNCTQCGKCCHDTNIPLTITEAIAWLRRGHVVKLICEATPWTRALDDEPRAAHFKRRSFLVTSGTVPTRVVVMLAGNIVGACPNLLPDQRCGIYEDRPLVCRIYPAEVSPMISLEPRSKRCPPEAWGPEHPVLQNGAEVMDAVVRHDVGSWRARDTIEATARYRLCRALGIQAAAVVHEAALVYAPTYERLLWALSAAIVSELPADPTIQWHFVSSQEKTLGDLKEIGASAVHAHDAADGSFQLYGAKREATFDYLAPMIVNG